MIRIESVTITPNPVTTNHSITIEVTAYENDWGAVKEKNANWNAVKINNANWEVVKNGN